MASRPTGLELFCVTGDGLSTIARFKSWGQEDPRDHTLIDHPRLSCWEIQSGTYPSIFGSGDKFATFFISSWATLKWPSGEVMCGAVRPLALTTLNFMLVSIKSRVKL